MSDSINEIIRETQKEYDLEYRTPRLNIVTSEMDETGDKCDDCNGSNKKVTVMKYYTVRPKEYFTERQYESYNGRTVKTHIITIPPRKFYNETQVYSYANYINKIAGRTLESDEMNLLLKTISRGGQYKLTCVIDITDQLKDQTIWKDIK